MLLALVLIVLTAFFLFYTYKKRAENYEGIRDIPGPPTLPIIGNVLELGTNSIDLFKNLNKLVEKYGPIIKLWFGPNLTILLTEPTYVELVLAEYDTQRTDLHKLMKGIFGNGIGSSAGQRWKTQRRMLAPFYNNNAVAEFVGIFDKNAEILVKQLATLSQGISIDITRYLWKCSFNSICNTTMQLDLVEKRRYIDAMQWIVKNAVERNFSLIKRFDCVYRFTSDYKIERGCLQVLDDLTEFAIKKHRENLGENKNLKFVDYLLKISEDHALTDEDIRDEIKTFVFAGMDTVASTTQFAVFELAKHPEVQAKILEETNSFLGENKHADVTYVNLENCVYTERVCKEVLRRYSPIHVVERKLKNATVLGNHVIPPGTTVTVFPNAMHNSGKYFPDPERFDPDRFLPGNRKHVLPQSYIPFGIGPRICLGQKYGLTEVKVILVKIIRSFELISVKPEHVLKLSMSGTLKSANGFPIILKRR